MITFRRLLHSLIVAVWLTGGTMVVGYAVYLLPVSLHLLPATGGLAAWAYEHSAGRGGKIGLGLLITTVFWPAAIIIFEIATYIGLALASTIDALLTRRLFNLVDLIDVTFAADPDELAAYAGAHGFSTGAKLIDTDKQSLLLASSETIAPRLTGTIHGCGFTWYQTTGDVYAIRTSKTFPHIYVRSQLNLGNHGLSAGHIGGVTPITLEADFGRYFTAYAPGSSAQIDVREVLTPDFMLAMLLSAPTADFELLDGTLFVAFPQTTPSDAVAYAEFTSLDPVIRQLLEENLFSFNPLSPSFRPPRLHVDLGRLADKATGLSFKFVGLFFLFLILALGAHNLPKVGLDTSFVLFLLALVCLAVCGVLMIGIVYASVLYGTLNNLRELFINTRVRRLTRSYRDDYAQE